jgi:outer membrane biosynthesis protein TonB
VSYPIIMSNNTPTCSLSLSVLSLFSLSVLCSLSLLDTEGQANCIECVPGKVQALVGKQLCTECKNGTFRASDDDLAECKNCPIGYFQGKTVEKIKSVLPHNV